MQAVCRAGASSAASRLARVLVPVVALLTITPVTCNLAAQTGSAQDATAGTGRRFEVASVKPNQQTLAEFVQANPGNAAALGSIGIRTLPGGRMTASFVTLRALILRAFDVKTYQLEGGPSWLNTTNFTIDARATGDATPEEFNVMLKALLVERFALRTRTEQREMPVYELTLARSDGRLGPQLKPTSAECLATLEERRKNPGQVSSTPRPAARSIDEARDMMRTPVCGATSMLSPSSSSRAMMVSIGGQPLSTLVSRLSSEVNAAVVDKTGLAGSYDIVLEYEAVNQPVGSASGNPSVPESVAPPLRTAVQQQLGLKLEQTRAPLPIVIVESAQQPTPD